jgi:hypothetical protein
MLQSLSEYVTRSVSRRSFLSKTASAAGAIALTLLGVKPAYAIYNINGCHLCNNPASCSYTGCTCQWSWIGTPQDTGDGYDYYKCWECYTAAGCPTDGTNCDPGSGWKCSKAVYDHHSGGGGGGGGGCKPSGYCY